MINTKLANKCYSYNFEKLFKKKGYAWFTEGIYNLNIIGIRSKNKKVCTNMFDDILVIDYNNGKSHVRKLYQFTTTPGLYYLNHPCDNKGTAILYPAQYRAVWQIGMHKGKYKALVQRKPMYVYRDTNKDSVYDLKPETLEHGVFGINLHRTNEFISANKIDKWSAGCQVLSCPSDFKSVMALCEKQAELYGNTFTYTLIDEVDLSV